MVIPSERKCLMVLVMISVSMVMFYLVSNSTALLSSNMVVLQIDSVVSNEIKPLNNKFSDENKNTHPKPRQLKQDSPKDSAIPNTSTPNEMPEINGHTNLVSCNCIIDNQILDEDNI